MIYVDLLLIQQALITIGAAMGLTFIPKNPDIVDLIFIQTCVQGIANYLEENGLGGGGGGTWGSITGTLANQTDLADALALLSPLFNPTFTGTVNAGAADLGATQVSSLYNTGALYDSTDSEGTSSKLLVGGASPAWTGTLPNGVVATTQTAGSDDTKVATDAYVDSAVGVEKSRAEAAEANLQSALPEYPSASSGPWFFAGYEMGYMGSTATGNAAFASTANKVSVWLIYVATPIVIGTVTFALTTKGAASGVAGIGMYSLAGSLLWQVNPSTYVATGNISTSLATPYTLGEGWYYFAVTSNETTSQMTYWSVTSGTTQFAMANKNVVRWGAYSSTASSGGTLPNALGTLTTSTASMFMILLET